MEYKFCLFISTFLLLMTPATSNPIDETNNIESELPRQIVRRINSFANALLGCSSMVGFNLAVVQNGRTVFSNGYGFEDLEQTQKVTADTVYAIGSITKTMTSTLLGKILHEQGISWDTKVRDVLSDEEFQFIDPSVSCQATLKDLGAHRTGVATRNYAVFQDISREQLTKNMRFSSQQDAFRNDFTYNNNLYGVLAYIVERLTGENFEELMTRELFRPLKMRSTKFWSDLDLSRNNLPESYLDDPIQGTTRIVSKQLLRSSDKVGAGAGSVLSTPEDMAEYIKLQMNLGVVDGTRIIPEEVFEEVQAEYSFSAFRRSILKPQFPVGYQTFGYGLGSTDGTYRGYKLERFTGQVLGHGSSAAFLPDVNIGIYIQGVSTVEDDGVLKRTLLSMYIADVLLGERPWLDETTACTFPEPWSNADVSNFNLKLEQGKTLREKLDISKLSKKVGKEVQIENTRYVGQYGNFQYGNVSVVSDGSGNLMLYYGFGEWQLIPTKENVFIGFVGDAAFPLYLPSVEFRNSNAATGSFHEVLLGIYDPDSSVFERGLKMSDAPTLEPLNC